jgi:hypothetical protein
MDTVKFSCIVNTNIPTNPINLKILLDDKIMFDRNIESEEEVHFEFNEDNQDHILNFVISGKTDDHNIRDDDGKILDSTEISITNIAFDDIDISSIIMVNPLKYEHNFNGNGDNVEDKFYDIAGCNGTVELKFSTPIYLWILENM